MVMYATYKSWKNGEMIVKWFKIEYLH